MIFRFDTISRPARAAKAVRDAFASCGVDLGLCAAQDVTAKAYGYASYHELIKSVGRHPPSEWDANQQDMERRIAGHSDVFEAAGLTHGDAWQVAYGLQLTAKRFPFQSGRSAGGRARLGPPPIAPVAGDPLTAMGLTRVQAGQLRAARKEDGGVFLVGGASWCERDALVDALLREPGPKPMGGYRCRSGQAATELDEAFDVAKAAGWRGTAIDFGHSSDDWRDGRLLAAAQGGAQAWLTMHPEWLTTLDRHFQDMLGFSAKPSAPRAWEHPSVIGIQSRMVCLMGFDTVKRTCLHCRLTRDEVAAKDPEKARRISDLEIESNVDLPATARFVDRSGCGKCRNGISGRGIAASVMITDERLNRLLLERGGESPHYHSREVHDAWRERGNFTAQEILIANAFAGFIDPTHQNQLILEDCEPENVRNALAIARDEGWEVR